MASPQLNRLSRRIDGVQKSVVAAVAPALLKSGEELVGVMRQLVPVDEGNLRDSLTSTGPGGTTPSYSQPGGNHVVPANEVHITAGNSETRYPHLVEFGTVNAPAQPFFFSAYYLLRKRLAARIKRSISKAVKDGWNTV